VTARDEMDAATAGPADLNDALLAIDVANTARRARDVVAGPADSELRETLRGLYRQQGIDIPDSALDAGLAAAADGRFGYVPRKDGIVVTHARLYEVRDRWLPATVAVVLMFVIGFGGFFFIYRPWHDAQAQQSELELSQRMPATMDALYQTIYDETKVQQAASDALAIRDRGRAAAAKGDRATAQQAIDDLTLVRDRLRQDYQLKVVDGPGVKWGFWTFPKSNAEATNYYLIVQPLDAQGKPETLPVRDEETGRTDTVTVWAERVPEEVYRAVEADKADDGVIEQNLVAVKDSGFLEADYLVQALGGQLTRW
jgi:hypothetical protein